MKRILIPTLLGLLILTSPALAQMAPGDAQQLVDSWYQKFLNRQRDAWSSVWIDALRAGQPPEAMLSKILSSQEYYEKSGGTPEGFVQTLYLDLAGREPTPQEVNYWVQRQYQADRADVAYQLLLRYPQAWQWQGGIPGGAFPPQPGYEPQQPSYEPQQPSYDYRAPVFPYRRLRVPPR